MTKLTGYELSRKWFDWSLANPDLTSPTHTALFMWYIEKWNRCGQNEKISVTTTESMDAIGVKSRNTLSKVFKDLAKFGFINIITESHNQYSCNVISLVKKISKHEDGTRTAPKQARGRHEDSTRTINKVLNIEQLNNTLPFQPKLEAEGEYQKPESGIEVVKSCLNKLNDEINQAYTDTKTIDETKLPEWFHQFSRIHPTVSKVNLHKAFKDFGRTIIASGEHNEVPKTIIERKVKSHFLNKFNKANGK